MAKIGKDNPSLQDIVANSIRPALLLVLGIYYFFLSAIYTVVLERDLIGLFDIQKLRSKSFSRFWNAWGPIVSRDLPDPVHSLLASTSGVVLDVGPGSGAQLRKYRSSKATVFYGVEPEIALHSGLRKSIKNNGFEGKYYVLTCGAERESLVPALAKEGLLQQGIGNGVFDHIICLRVLCGVTNLEDTVDGLYRLLKPGGTLIVSEHVKSPWPEEGGLIITWLLQKVYKLFGWSFWLGGCNIDRDTERALLRAAGSGGGWQKVDLEMPTPWQSIPELSGYLAKRSEAPLGLEI